MLRTREMQLWLYILFSFINKYIFNFKYWFKIIYLTSNLILF
jgi:hypothetical protein